MYSLRRPSMCHRSSRSRGLVLAWLVTIVLAIQLFAPLNQIFAQPPAPEASPKTATSKPTNSRAAIPSRVEIPGGRENPQSRSASSRKRVQRLRPRSPFLIPPGTSPGEAYGEEELELPVAANDILGIRAKGQFFIYVLDGSGSMIDEDRFPRATIELRAQCFRTPTAATIRGHFL